MVTAHVAPVSVYVLNPLCVGKSKYSKEKFGILEDNLKPPPSSSESWTSKILTIEVAPYFADGFSGQPLQSWTME